MFTLLFAAKALKPDRGTARHTQPDHAAPDRAVPTNVPLDKLPGGGQGVVRSIGGASTPLRQRLMELGITIGSDVEVIRKAPFGGPIEISIRGYRLSLRRTEARIVMVERRRP